MIMPVVTEVRCPERSRREAKRLYAERSLQLHKRQRELVLASYALYLDRVRVDGVGGKVN
jgi:hypothetical protein